MADSIPPVTPVAPAPSLPKVGAGSAPAKTARAFEAVFLGQMAQLMLGTVDTGSEFTGGHGEEMFKGILAEKLGGAMAARGGIGLAPIVMQQILKLQGGGNAQ